MPDDFKVKWADIITRPCHDCGVRRGELHLDGCDMEACPSCGGQYMCCDCRIDDDDDLDVLDAPSTEQLSFSRKSSSDL
jgi:hypothetical protein